MKKQFSKPENIIPLTSEERNQMREFISKLNGRVFFQEKNAAAKKILEEAKNLPH